MLTLTCASCKKTRVVAERNKGSMLFDAGVESCSKFFKATAISHVRNAKRRFAYEEMSLVEFKNLAASSTNSFIRALSGAFTLRASELVECKQNKKQREMEAAKGSSGKSDGAGQTKRNG